MFLFITLWGVGVDDKGIHWVEIKGVIKHPTRPSPASMTKNCPTLTVDGAKVEKLQVRAKSPHWKERNQYTYVFSILRHQR